MTIHIRPAKPEDAEACGRIIYRAFADIAGRHGFPPDFPGEETAVGLAKSLTGKSSVFGVVAEADGRIVGSNFLQEGDPIRSVGPITVDPETQDSGVGRKLMQAVVDRANGAKGIRLLQDSFNMLSISLYASLGFEVREPVLVMTGTPEGQPPAGYKVRPMTEGDIADSDALCRRVHGISRRGELEEAVRSLAPLVAEKDGAIAAYMTAPTIWIVNHGAALSDDAMQALILGAAAKSAPLSFLLPTRQAALFRWCLDKGMRALKPMTLMATGKYRQPDGAYMPSVFY